MKSVSVLGVTGSIGDSALDIIENAPEKFKLVAAAARSDWQKLVTIAHKFKPSFVAIEEASAYNSLKSELSGTGIEVLGGAEGVIELAGRKYDLTVSAIVGFNALRPTLAAIKGSKRVAMANKESIVCAGNLMLEAAKLSGCEILPVDSEHNALFQVFESGNIQNINNLTITASGGALRNYTRADMTHVTPDIATTHPNWKMGAKITVDCATLANKGLEFIEACVLFNLPPEAVDVLVHPESIIHGMVHYKDGSVLAQLGYPDMRTPISYAMAYPNRLNIEHKPLDLSVLGSLNFERPDFERFPLLRDAINSMHEGLAARIIFNTANEIAVNAFLAKRIPFLRIESTVQSALDRIEMPHLISIDEVFSFNEMVKQEVRV